MTKVCMICGDTFPDATTFCAKDGSPLRAVVQGDSLIGELFCDRYVVTAMLGEGGMGAVYAASDVRLPQQVAIKVLREQGMSDPTIVARFRQEAEAASRINHDRVARVTDFGFMKDGRAYLVMEYVGGRTLKQTVADRGSLSVAETARIVTMVAEGLDAAHRLGIVHRDLKPDNVMILDDAGGGVRLKVLDFGIAKVLHANEESAGQTKTGFVIGTPQWMSPEQILGETLDARSDVYALALLAYMMMTGHRAFEGKSAESEMMARLSSPPKPLAEVQPSVTWPEGLQALLNRTLARDVSERPSGALIFAREFAAIAATAANTVATISSSGAANVAADNTPPAAAYSSFKTSESSKPSSLNDSVSAATGKRSKLLPAVVGIAALAVVAFLGFRQWSGRDTPTIDTGETPTGTTAADSANRAAADAQTAAATTTGVPTNADASNSAANQRVPDQPARTASRPTDPGNTKVSPPRDSAKGAAGRGAGTAAASSQRDNDDASKASATAASATAASATAASATAASAQLRHLMDVADDDLARKDLLAMGELIPKLQSLLPDLAASTDKGNVHFYVAMLHNALGDNVKACASFSRAEPLATQSPALRSNVEQWQNLLKCAP